MFISSPPVLIQAYNFPSLNYFSNLLICPSAYNFFCLQSIYLRTIRINLSEYKPDYFIPLYSLHFSPLPNPLKYKHLNVKYRFLCGLAFMLSFLAISYCQHWFAVFQSNSPTSVMSFSDYTFYIHNVFPNCAFLLSLLLFARFGLCLSYQSSVSGKPWLNNLYLRVGH